MNHTPTLARRILDGNAAADAAAAGIIRLRRNNLIERPWGGLRMLDYKGCAPLPDQKRITGLGIGEAFETAACDSDFESGAHPSIACLRDGSQIALPKLLAGAGLQILGHSLYGRFRGEIPLLPKTLDIAELLSVQAHPPGNTELYLIIDAEPGASIRLGFRHSIDADSLRQELVEGRAHQQALLSLLRDNVDINALQACLAPLLADRSDNATAAQEQLGPWLRDETDRPRLAELLEELKGVYWHVLDLMNEIVVRPGQIVYNATPARICDATGTEPSAEVHALGNPAGREILMLEIRRPGVTYRAWDNVRFPMREVNIDRALTAMNLGATSSEEFEVTPEEADDTAGLYRLVRSDAFAVDQLRPDPGTAIQLPPRCFATLHAIRGESRVSTPDGNSVQLSPGESALVPECLSGVSVTSDVAAELIRAWIPGPQTASN